MSLEVGGPEVEVLIDVPGGLYRIDPICIGFKIGEADGSTSGGGGDGGVADTPIEIEVCVALELSTQGDLVFEPALPFSDDEIGGFVPECAETAVSPSCTGGVDANTCPPCDPPNLRASPGCGVPSDLGGGHFRGAVGASFPIPDTPLTASVDGEVFLRFGDDPLVAFNADVGVGMGFFGLDAGSATSYILFEDNAAGVPVPTCIVTAAASMDWDKIYPGLGALMSLTSASDQRYFVKIDIAAGAFQGGYGFKIMGMDASLGFEAGLLADGGVGVGFEGCLAAPLGIAETAVQGTLEVEADGDLLLCLSGQRAIEILGVTLADARFRASNHAPAGSTPCPASGLCVCVVGRACLDGIGHAEVTGVMSQQADGAWDLELHGDAEIDLTRFGLPLATGEVWVRPSGVELDATVELPHGIGSVRVSGTYRSRTDFELRGTVSAGIDGFGVSGTVTISDDGIDLAGWFDCGGDEVYLDGSIESDGDFLLEGSGSISTSRVRIDGSFELERDGDDVSFTADGSVTVDGRSLADAAVLFSTDGGISMTGDITFAGTSFDACFCVTPSGDLGIDASVNVPTISFPGVKVWGDVQLCASVGDGCDDPHGDPCGAAACDCASSNSIGARFSGSAKVPVIGTRSISACVSSSGKISFEVSAGFLDRSFSVDILD